jgi:hypothetical protein
MKARLTLLRKTLAALKRCEDVLKAHAADDGPPDGKVAKYFEATELALEIARQGPRIRIVAEACLGKVAPLVYAKTRSRWGSGGIPTDKHRQRLHRANGLRKMRPEKMEAVLDRAASHLKGHPRTYAVECKIRKALRQPTDVS